MAGKAVALTPSERPAPWVIHVEILTDAGAVDKGRYVSSAAGQAREGSVKFLLEQHGRGTAADKRAYVNNTHDFLGRTPLACAVHGFGRYSSCRIVRMLLDNGADATCDIPWLDPATHVALLRVSREVIGGYATEEQMQRLEGIHRLLLQVDAVHATSWLWHSDVTFTVDAAAEGTSKTKTTSTPLRMMLPILRRRTRRPRVLLATLFR